MSKVKKGTGVTSGTPASRGRTATKRSGVKGKAPAGKVAKPPVSKARTPARAAAAAPKKPAAKAAAGRKAVATKAAAGRKPVRKTVAGKKSAPATTRRKTAEAARKPAARPAKGASPKRATAAKPVKGKRIVAKVPPARTVKIKALDPVAKCGPATSVQFLYRVDELLDGAPRAHLVFFDRHGWYCEHGRNCPAVADVRKHGRQHHLFTD